MFCDVCWMTVLLEKKIHTLEQEVEETRDETPKIHMVCGEVWLM